MDRNISAFLAIAKYGNLTLAAKNIGLTQPALTKRLNNLEQQLQCKLFERHRLGVTLNPAGHSFLRRAVRVEQELLQASEELRSLEEAGLDVLRIGAGPLFHQRYVAPVFSKLLLEFPALRLDLTVSANELSIPELMKGDLDIVLGAIQPIGPDGAITLLPMTTLEHGVITSKKTELADQKQIFPQQMRDMKWVLYGADKDTEIWLNSYFLRNSLGAPHIAVRTASFATGLGLVRDSGFVMMAPIQLAPVIEDADLKIIPANPTISKLTSGAYVRPSSMGFPAIKRFLELLKLEINSNVNSH